MLLGKKKKERRTLTDYCVVPLPASGPLPTASSRPWGTFGIRGRYEEDVERVRDVTGAGFVEVENARPLSKRDALRGTTRARGADGG